LQAVGEPGLGATDADAGLHAAFSDALRLSEEAGLLLWNATLGITLGSRCAGLIDEADAAVARGAEFLRSRGAGGLAEALLHATTRHDRGAAEADVTPAGDVVVN
jgi:hypothetical protein